MKRVEFAVFGTLTVDSVETSKGVSAVSMAQDPQVASQHLAARAAESERWADYIVDLDFLMSASRFRQDKNDSAGAWQEHKPSLVEVDLK